MADSAGQADIRNINVTKLVEGFAEEGIILKNYVRVIPTSAREIRWQSKTAGFLTGPTTTAITSSLIANTATGAVPVTTGPSFTRSTSYVRKYMMESEFITDEDIKDSQPDVWGETIRDAVRAVNYQVDARILTVMDAAGCQTAAATGNGWNVDADGDPIQDFLAAREAFKAYGYATDNMVAYMNQAEEKWLMRWLINVKGSSIPQFSSNAIGTARVIEIVGVKIVSSANRPTDTVTVFIPEKAVIWYEFSKTQTAVIDDAGIGKKVRVWCEGEAVRPNPYAVFKITDTIN